MYLGLLIVCIYVIFHRSRAPWRTALRMAEVFFAIFVAAIVVAIAFALVVAHVAGIAAVVAAVIAGLQHAGWDTKHESSAETDSASVNER